MMGPEFYSLEMLIRDWFGPYFGGWSVLNDLADEENQ